MGSAQESNWKEKNIVKRNRDEIWTMMVFLLRTKLIGSLNTPLQELLGNFISIGYAQHGKVLYV